MRVVIKEKEYYVAWRYKTEDVQTYKGAQERRVTHCVLIPVDKEGERISEYAIFNPKDKEFRKEVGRKESYKRVIAKLDLPYEERKKLWIAYGSRHMTAQRLANVLKNVFDKLGINSNVNSVPGIPGATVVSGNLGDLLNGLRKAGRGSGGDKPTDSKEYDESDY